jgi:hypothetical protein
MPVQQSLNERQKKFVAAYLLCGVASQAYRDAGYAGDANVVAVSSHRLLRNPKIVAELEHQQREAAKTAIATRQQRQAFWTRIQNDEALRPLERLKASELLARSHGDFIDKHEITGPNGGPIQIGTTVVHELIQAPQQQLQATIDDGSDL